MPDTCTTQRVIIGNPQKEENLCPKDKFQLLPNGQRKPIFCSFLSGQFVPTSNHQHAEFPKPRVSDPHYGILSDTRTQNLCPLYFLLLLFAFSLPGNPTPTLFSEIPGADLPCWRHLCPCPALALRASEGRRKVPAPMR